MTAFKSATSATILSLVIAALAASGPLAAQPMPQGQGRPGMTDPGSSGQMQPQMPGGMMGMMGQGAMSMMMGEHVEGRIAFLKAELKITDAQLPQWNTFADALRANAKRMSEIRNTMMQGGMMGQGGTSLSAPDRLDRMGRMMTAMLDAVKATKKSALEPLYAVLSDDQKKLANQLVRGPMGMGPM
jgi:LTXXQ motif family protein